MLKDVDSTEDARYLNIRCKLSNTRPFIGFRPYHTPESEFCYKAGTLKFGIMLNVTLVKTLGTANKHCQDRTQDLNP